jgi:ribosomal protein L29
MSFTKYIELTSLTNTTDIDQEIFLLQKNLFNLRIQKSRNQVTKPHLFIHAKRRIAQLKFRKFSLLKSNNLK